MHNTNNKSSSRPQPQPQPQPQSQGQGQGQGQRALVDVRGTAAANRLYLRKTSNSRCSVLVRKNVIRQLYREVLTLQSQLLCGQVGTTAAFSLRHSHHLHDGTNRTTSRPQSIIKWRTSKLKGGPSHQILKAGPRARPRSLIILWKESLSLCILILLGSSISILSIAQSCSSIEMMHCKSFF